MQKKQITFVSVDTSRDIEMLRRELIHIPKEYHVDLQVVFGIKECGKKAGIGRLAAKIIDDSYLHMKGKCTDAMHKLWHEPLTQKHLEYAAVDAYVCFEMYKKILAISEGLGLGLPVLNDSLCVRCKSGEDYKSYKRLKEGWQKDDQNRWEQGSSAENTTSDDQEEDEGKGKDLW